MFPISIFFLLIVWIAHDSYDSLDSCPLFVPSLEQDTPLLGVCTTMQAGIAKLPQLRGLCQRWFFQLAATPGPGNLVLYRQAKTP